MSKKQSVKQFSGMKVFGLVDEQDKPMLINEGIILVQGNRIYALSRDSFESCCEVDPALSSNVFEDFCVSLWEEQFGQVEDAK